MRLIIHGQRGFTIESPIVIRVDEKYMHRADGEKVTRLTPGDLFHCQVLATARAVAMMRQKSAEAIVAARTHGEGLNKVN